MAEDTNEHLGSSDCSSGIEVADNAASYYRHKIANLCGIFESGILWVKEPLP